MRFSLEVIEWTVQMVFEHQKTHDVNQRSEFPIFKIGPMGKLYAPMPGSQGNRWEIRGFLPAQCSNEEPLASGLLLSNERVALNDGSMVTFRRATDSSYS